ncbi:hypothetical protein OEZ86_001956 [Tetradesmus obliquus]|nr:hypothetical protein OEZ86_001956 [Tetradesmus obliquus]
MPQPQQLVQITLASVPKLSVTSGLHWGGSQAAAAAGHSSAGQGGRARQLPCRDLESELAVLRAVHAREDAVDKLRACCAKVSAALGAGGPGSMLLPSDPLGRLFYRLVASLRSKTLDVIECHAAWQRKISNPSEPFSYKGRPYLLSMGQGLGFLDEAGWLAGRLLHCSAVQDVLLAELTPDGVALDAVAGCDVRHGPP